jgi:Ca-activated chloride channel homolog
MTFVTPLALLGLFVLPVIVALHLRRSAVREVEVPSLILWDGLAAPARSGGKRWRLDNLPTLLPQLVAAAVLVLALARPSSLTTSASTRVYMLDAGVLMSVPDPAPTRMRVAQMEISRDIRSAPAGTTFTIVAAGPRPRVVVSTTDRAIALQHVNAIAPIAAMPDLQRAVNLAAALTPAQHGRLELVYARGEIAPQAPRWPATVTRLVVGRSTDNQSIASLTVRCQTDATTCDALAAVRNDAGAVVDDTVDIDADSAALGRETLILPAHSVTDLSFSVPAAHQIVQLYLTRTDLVASDNLAWAAIPREPVVHVLVVGDATRTTPIVRALHAARIAPVSTITPTHFSAASTAGSGLLILIGWVPPARLPAAPSILLIDPPSYPGAAASKPVDDATVSAIDGASPLLAGLDMTSLDVPAAGARLLSLPPALHPIVSSTAGTLIAAGTLHGSRIATVDFDPVVSNFSQLPAFPLFFKNVARWTSQWFSPVTTPGAVIDAESPPATTSIAVTRASSLAAPAVRVPVSTRVADTVSVDVGLPGIYTISERGSWGSRVGIAIANTANGAVAGSAPTVSSPPPSNADAGASATASWWPLLGVLAALFLAAELLVTPRRGDG